MLGTWRETQAGLSYEVVIRPAGMLFGSDFIINETVVWAGRHVVTRVRKVVLS